jgi:hypothetical protein
VRPMAAGLGQGGVVRRWRDCSRRDLGEGGLLIDLWQIVVGSSRCQLHLLIGDPIPNGRFRLLGWLQAPGHESPGQSRGPPGTSGPQSGLGRRARWSPDDGRGCGRRRSGAQAQTQQHLMMITNDTMKAAPAMLNAQLDMEASETEAEWAVPN